MIVKIESTADKGNGVVEFTLSNGDKIEVNTQDYKSGAEVVKAVEKMARAR